MRLLIEYDIYLDIIANNNMIIGTIICIEQFNILIKVLIQHQDDNV